MCRRTTHTHIRRQRSQTALQPSSHLSMHKFYERKMNRAYPNHWIIILCVWTNRILRLVFFHLLLSGCEERLWNENAIWIGSSLRSPSYSIRLNVKHTKKMEWNSWHMLFSLVFRLRSVFAMLSHSLLLQSVCVCFFLHSSTLACARAFSSHFKHFSIKKQYRIALFLWVLALFHWLKLRIFLPLPLGPAWDAGA